MAGWRMLEKLMGIDDYQPTKEGQVMACGTCRFFDRHISNYGDCRRHPPRFNEYDEATDMHWGTWPTVDEEWWCGEYAPRPRAESEGKP